MKQYLDLVQDILANGKVRANRTNTRTRSIFGTQLRFDLRQGFPLLTTKKMFFRGIVEELLFFLRGDTNTKKLEEKRINIWSGNTSEDFLRGQGLPFPEGEMGPGYGFQWRNFGGTYQCHRGENGPCITKKKDGIDQLHAAINTIIQDPSSRRICVTAWHPMQINRMALPPCHMFFQFYVDDGCLSCQFYMRSVDVGLGLPFNIASYALLTHIVAESTGLWPGALIFTGGDTHIYENHVPSLRNQLGRETLCLPRLEILKRLQKIEDLEALEYKDFQLTGYKSHEKINMPMAV